MGMFDGKIVVVTGAGGGLGRCHALGFAKEGAKVVINDLGTAPDGSGENKSMANMVVEEIKKLGGTAVANYDSVATKEGAEGIVKTALDNFGRIDIFVNNAGILRDKTLLNMPEDWWDIIIDVHLKGTFLCSQAAARAMKDNGWGRIINTTSLAGLMGNFGQTNYSAAKAGIYGLTRAMSLELDRYGITVNVIAPIAKTRLTEDIVAIPEEMVAEQVTPFVLFLASDMADGINGRVFGIHGQQLLEYKMVKNEGVKKETDELWTPQEIMDHFDEISSFPEIAEGVPTSGEGITAVSGPRFSLTMNFASIEELQRYAQGLATGIPPLVDTPTTVTEPEESPLTTAIQRLTKIYEPDKAKGWTANIQFKVDGQITHTLEISDGKSSIAEGKKGTPTCTIEIDGEAVQDMMSGTLDPTKAYMQGRLKGDNMGDLMKLGRAFNFNKLPEVIKSEGGAQKVIEDAPSPAEETKPEPEEKKPEGMNRDYIGTMYTGDAHFVKPEKVKQYALATNESNPRYLQEPFDIPPLFPVSLLPELLTQIVEDADEMNLNLLRMVHAEHEMYYLEPMKPMDLIYGTAEIVSMEKRGINEFADVKVSCLHEGKPVVQMVARMMVRGMRKPGEEKKPSAPPEPLDQGKKLAEHVMKVTDDQSLRYADASGDDNPIHTDEDVARMAGLPGIILQGLCTMAFGSQAIVDKVLNGDPVRLKSLKVRFTKPVLMGDNLTTEIYDYGTNDKGLHELRFETKNQENVVVLGNGVAEVTIN